MKITNNVDYKSYNNSLHNIDMGLDVSKTDSIMTLLRNSIYSNPIESFVREIYSNAIDAHLKSGIELPIKVTIELSEKEDCVNFVVRDFGNSMTVEDFKNVYAKMGSSTKNNSNTEMGGFGLGAKSPLAYTNEFFIDTWTEEDGRKIHRSWVQYIDKSQVGKISLLKEEDTTEKSGTQIKIPVTKVDAYNLEKAINKYLSYSILPFEVEGFTFKDCRYHLGLIGKNWGLDLNHPSYSYRDSNKNCTLIIGGIPYPIEKHSLGNRFLSNDYTFLIKPLIENKTGIENDVALFENFIKAFGSFNFVLVADIGMVDLSASREALQYTDKTCFYLYKKIFSMFQEYCIHLKLDFVKNPSYLNACSNYRKFCNRELKSYILNYLVWEPENLALQSYPIIFSKSHKWANKFALEDRGHLNTEKVLRKQEIDRLTTMKLSCVIFVKQDTEYKNYSKFLKDYLIRVKPDQANSIVVINSKDMVYLCNWITEHTPIINLSDIITEYKEYYATKKVASKNKRDNSVFNSFKYTNEDCRPKAFGIGRFFIPDKAPSNPETPQYYIIQDEFDQLEINKTNICFPEIDYWTKFHTIFTNYLKSKNIDLNSVWFMTKASTHFSKENWINLVEVIKQEYQSIDFKKLENYNKKVYLANYIPMRLPAFRILKPEEGDTTSLYSRLYKRYYDLKVELKYSEPEFYKLALFTDKVTRDLNDAYNNGTFRLGNEVYLKYKKDPNVQAYLNFYKNYSYLYSINDYHDWTSSIFNEKSYYNYIKAMTLLFKDENTQIIFEDEPKDNLVNEFGQMMQYFNTVE